MEKSNQMKKSPWDGEFQEIYIFTCQEMYRYTNLLMQHRAEKAKELLVVTYAEAYERKTRLPSMEKQLVWLKKLAETMAETHFHVPKTEIEMVQAKEKGKSVKGHISPAGEMDITSVFLEIEDRIALLTDSEESGAEGAGTMSKIQLVFSGFVVCAAIVMLGAGVTKVKEQLDVWQEPFIKPLETDGTSEFEERMAKMESQKIKVGGKAVILSDVGQVLYSLPLEDAGMEGKPKDNPEIQKQKGWTYYLPAPERKNSQLGDVASSLHHTLYRVGTQGEELEIIARDVDDYLLWEDSIYVSQYGRIQHIDQADIFEKQVPGLEVDVRNEEVYLHNTLGKPIKLEADGRLLYEDRMFQMASGRIEDVAPAPRAKGHVTYYFKNTERGISKEIYRNLNGKEEVFIKQDLTIDSFCIAGDWLYYSAYIRKGGSGAHYSEIYRKSLVEDKEPEKLREEFTGRLLQLYFSEEQNQIYGNYIPKNWKSNKGVIAVISLSGQMSYLDDKTLRQAKETSGNDMLEFILAKDGQVYAYWMDCAWKPGEAPVALWRKVLIIPDHQRISIE